MALRKTLTSRWLLLPATLIIGVAIGAAATLVWAQRRVTSELPFRACSDAEVLARLDQGDAAGARYMIRVDLEATLQAAAVNAEIWQVDLKGKSRELRNVATYLSRDPTVQLPPAAASLMGAFEPFTAAELDRGRCQSGICKLARSTPPRPQTQPSE